MSEEGCCTETIILNILIIPILVNGLPPGPITNPSFSSLEAAAQPEQHKYLYMVASPKGTHTFSTNYEDHLKASKVWRDWIQEQYRIKREREQSPS